MRIDQCLPVLAPRDAIGQDVLAVRRALREAGWDSDVYAEVIDRDLRDLARPWSGAPSGPDRTRVWLYHASTWGPMADQLVERATAGERVAVVYHNITPAAYLERWLPGAAAEMVRARESFARLAPLAELTIGVSAYNTAEAAALGASPAVTSPLLLDLDRFAGPVERRPARSHGGAWLFVGRIVPNKCQHDVIAALAVYRRLFDPAARLTLVGGATAPLYERALLRQAAELDVGSAVEIIGGISDRDLRARFSSSDVLVCLSEHEGFCVPLIEAMASGLPVVAYAAAAVPETVEGAAVLLDDKDPVVVARAAADLLGDPGRTGRLVAAGRERAADFALPRTTASLVEALRRLCP